MALIGSGHYNDIILRGEQELFKTSSQQELFERSSQPGVVRDEQRDRSCLRRAARQELFEVSSNPG